MVYGIGLVYVSMINLTGLYLKNHDLTPTDMNILMLARHHAPSQGMAQVDLGEKLMVTAHNMTRAIQRLEKKGLLKRVIDNKDARINRVTMTVKGSQLLDDIWPGYEKVLLELAGRIPSDDQKTVTHLLQQWLKNKGA